MGDGEGERDPPAFEENVHCPSKCPYTMGIYFDNSQQFTMKCRSPVSACRGKGNRGIICSNKRDCSSTGQSDGFLNRRLGVRFSPVPPGNGENEMESEDDMKETAQARAAQGMRPDRPPKEPKTPEELAAIAFLDRLRTGEGETAPENLPRACVVEIVDYVEIPKANERYALATVSAGKGRQWKLCIGRYYLEKGMRALFLTADAAIPAQEVERYRDSDVTKLKERVYRYGFGVKERRWVPFVKRGVYRHNCGVLYPLDNFGELAGQAPGTDCSALLHLESAAELQARQNRPRPNPSAVGAVSFAPSRKGASKRASRGKSDSAVAQAKAFLAKVRLHRARFLAEMREK